ncbi:helix-turn-helix transcriptional regulator [Halomonas sp. HL-93]|uniref:helix-turn-helix transcriptional regulator n=1 Tax=Halomonas sp. HL-93 TaxID=1666906 RepID=UPI0006D982FE|nr:AraC family transcriptional regulator [Halomonas sp. HL-93]KPQ20267.1 MAG: AraC family transcriptional regulator [Halomonas sp. HL-93]SBR45161.1 AraC-type DNA-binding protein [Halomonas sp. HL-93]
MTTATLDARASQPLYELTPGTLAQLGQRFGIDYRVRNAPAESSVATGSVRDVALPQAMHLTLSDLCVNCAYSSSSRQTAPWFISVVLEGHISARLGSQRFQLNAGDGMCAHFTPQQPLTVFQPAQTRLHTVNVAVLATTSLDLPPLPTAPGLYPWRLSAALAQALRHAAAEPLANWRQPLIWQGLALQLLGDGLPHHGQQDSAEPLAAQTMRGISARDEQRLAILHAQLAAYPSRAYCLNDLARETAMSPSSLRHKFRTQYGCSIFDHLRQCRLAKAYQDLQRGMSVQQVAHTCGYRHATNFATAFRRRFGIAPNEVATQRVAR